MFHLGPNSHNAAVLGPWLTFTFTSPSCGGGDVTAHVVGGCDAGGGLVAAVTW